MFFENDIPLVSSEWVKILENQRQSEPTDEGIWELICCDLKPPHIGNAWMYLTLSKIQRWCTERHIKCEYFINAMDSHLYINGEEIHDFEKYVRTVTVVQAEG